MDKYLDANDILSLAFLALKDVDCIKEQDVHLLILSLYEIRREKNRKYSLETVIDVETNYDKETFSLTEKGYVVNKRDNLLPTYKNILDNEKSNFNEDIYAAIVRFREKYKNKKKQKAKQLIR